MLSEVGVICFAGSYTLALILEVTRLFFRSGVRGVAMLACATAGFVAHTAFIYYHAVSPTGYPIASQQGWFFVASWLLVGVYLYLTLYHQRTPFGQFLLPVVLGLIGVGYFWADDTPFARKEALAGWAMFHGISLLLMSVTAVVGFVTGVMYLLQARRLKSKRPLRTRMKLPSLEWLQWANVRALVLTTFFLGVGILSGIVMNRLELADSRDIVPWHDPVVAGALVMFACLVGWQLLGLLFRPLREGHRLAYQTLTCFVLLVLVLCVGLLVETRHWRTPKEDGALPSNQQTTEERP